MHRCLHIQEILASIFDYMLYKPQRSGLLSLVDDKRSILALVKTCRTFNIPALRVLWKNLFSPVLLLLTMPEDLWHVERDVQGFEISPTLVSDQNIF